MQSLRIVMLLVTLTVGYLLFFHSQPQPSALPPDLTKTATTSAANPDGTAPRTEYKEAMNRAHAVAKQMQDQRKEADSD